MKKIIIAILTIALIVFGIGLYFKSSGFSFANLFKEQAIVIDKTKNVVEEIHRLAELTTATYYGEHVISKQKTSELLVSGIKISLLWHTISAKDEIVLITKGRVRAGFDLSKLEERDVVIDSISITLNLPRAQIFGCNNKSV